MARQQVSSGTKWGPIAGYSRAVRAGNLVFVAGTTAAVEDGGPVGGDDMGAQAREALRRIEAALQELGATLADVVQTRMFVTDIEQWEAVCLAHGEAFAGILPVSALVEVSRLIEPELLVEIEAVAVLG